ncbi:redoxin family protein [bacterium]|nr:redoxin family protein [bacterium]
MQKRLRWEVALAAALATSTVSRAEQPEVAQILRFEPAQKGVVYDTPAEEAYAKCKVDVAEGKERGYIVRDNRGLVIRRFSDTNGDGKVDRWSYFMNGQEVYRDIDTNFNGRPDEFHYYHSAGSRWGKDTNEDGKVDEWKSISAEEATAEIVVALSSGDVARIQPLMMTSSDIQQLGISADASGRVAESLKGAGAQFQQLARALGPKIQWNRFDGHNPMTVPGEEVGASTDLVLYLNGTILVDAGGDTRWIRVPELIRVGDAWKLSAAPSLIDQSQPLPTEGVIVGGMPDVVTTTQDNNEDGGDVVENDEEIRTLVNQLREHDNSIPRDAEKVDELVAYHLKRAEICAKIGAKSKKLANREHWYKQVADSFNAAVQTGKYDKGVETLRQYGEQFGKVAWGKTLAAYFLYRSINSDYAVKLTAAADPADLQKGFMKQLQDFLAAYPEAPDAADALWQLGNGMEFAGGAGEEDALKYYKELVTKHPDSPFAAKAQGALRRLNSLGQPFQLTGTSLGRGSVDTSQFRGKVVLISYWATWCEPCVEEMERLAKLREKYGKSGFEIVGVCLDNDKNKAVTFLREKGYAWPQMFEEGAMESKLATELGIISLPYLLLVDANGNVVNKNLQFGELEAEMAKIMTQKVAGRPGDSAK